VVDYKICGMRRTISKISCFFFILIGNNMQISAQEFFSNENVISFCTEENDLGIRFPAGTSDEEAFEFISGCLESSSSPQWFIMQIDEPGLLGITIEHSEGYDVDFACYGPFKGKNKQEVIKSINKDITIYAVEDEYLYDEDAYVVSDTCYSQSYLDEFDRVTALSDSIYVDCYKHFFQLDPSDFDNISEYFDYCDAEEEKLYSCIDETEQKEHVIFPPDPVQFDMTNPCFRGYNDNYPLESMVDCSYSTSSKEFCYIPEAKNGEWYLFLVTNYSQKPGTISFNKTAGTATTNCKIIVDAMTVGPVCEGESFELDVNNAPDEATFLWTGPKGFVSTEKNPTISNATQENSGIYTVVMVSNGVSSDEVEVPVVVNKRHVVDIKKEIKEGESYIFGDETLTISGEYQKTFTSETTGCDSVVNLSLTVLDKDSFIISSDSPVCEGNAISFKVLNSPKNATFSWTGPNGFSSKEESPTLDNVSDANSGRYSLSVTVNGIVLPTIETDVVVNKIQHTEIADSILQGETILFNGQRLSVSGTYQDTLVSATTGCDSIVTLILTVEELKDAMISNNSPLCEGERLYLYIDDAPEGVSYEWSGPDDFKSTEQNPTIDEVTKSNSGIYSVKYEYKGKSFTLTTPVVINSVKKQFVKAVIKGDETYKIGDAEYSEAGEYTVTLVSESDCDSIVYLNLTRACEANDLIPEIMFSPNSDGENDRWIIKNVELYSDITVKIYDRMGKLVREFDAYDNLENSWDGKDYAGRTLPSTDYWYVIDVDESDRQYVGHVTLLH
jgi:gliding motility-associated-like protein